MSATSTATSTADSVDGVLQQCLAGGPIDFHSLAVVDDLLAGNAKLLHQLHATHHTLDQTRHVLEQMTLRTIDPSVSISTPLRCDFGRHIFFGRNVFINTDCLLVDLGGIYLGDNVLLAPRVSIITVNHQLDPVKRRSLETASVRIERNAWIGAGATVLPGVTVGENSVVGAGAVVAGVPAKVIRQL